MTLHTGEQVEKPASPISYESVLARTTSGAAIVAFGFIVGNGLDYIVRISVARALGPEVYGVFELAYTLVMFAALVALSGMSTNIVRYVAQYSARGELAQAKGIVIQGMLIGLFASCTISVIMWLANTPITIALLDKPQLSAVLPIFLLGIPFFSLGSINLASLRGGTAMKWWTISQNLAPNLTRFAAILIVLPVFVQKLTVEMVIVVYVIGFIVRFAVSSYFVSKQPFMQRSTPIVAVKTSTLIMESLPLFLSDLMLELRRNLEVLMLGFFATTKDVGLYSAAVIIGQVVNVPVMTLERIFVPIAAQLFGRQQDEDVRKLYRTSTRWILYITAPVLAAITVYADAIVDLVLGEQYAAVAPILQILTIGYFMNGATGLWEQVLLARGRNVITMSLRMVWVATSIVTAAILVPRYGYIGAAWSATLPVILLQIEGVVTVWRLERAHPFSWEALRFILGTLLVFAFSYAATRYWQMDDRQIIWSLVAVLPLSYGVALLIAGLNAEDRFILTAGISRMRRALPFS